MASNTKAAEAKAVPTESIYSASELADNYKLFGVNREMVVIALQKAGKRFCTFSEAKAIIDKFKSKEVK